MSDALADLLMTAAASPPQESAADETADRILDAAVQEAAAVGTERMRVEDVVRRSGLARMTVYRRFPKRDDLVRALITRETQRFLATIAAAIEASPQQDDQGVEVFIAAVRFSRTHPMLRRLGDTGRGALMEALAVNDATMLTMGSQFLAARMLATSPKASPQVVRWAADVLARLFVTYVALPPTDPDPANEEELRAFARAVLYPLAEAAVRA
jgi:AcrR family transcriptional regulator